MAVDRRRSASGGGMPLWVIHEGMNPLPQAATACEPCSGQWKSLPMRGQRHSRCALQSLGLAAAPWSEVKASLQSHKA